MSRHYFVGGEGNKNVGRVFLPRDYVNHLSSCWGHQIHVDGANSEFMVLSKTREIDG